MGRLSISWKPNEIFWKRGWTAQPLHFCQAEVVFLFWIKARNLDGSQDACSKGSNRHPMFCSGFFCRDAFRAARGVRMLVHPDLLNGQDYEMVSVGCQEIQLNSCGQDSEMVSVGVPRNPTEFMRAAQKLDTSEHTWSEPPKRVEQAVKRT